MEELLKSARFPADPLMTLNEIFKYCYEQFFKRKTANTDREETEKKDFFRGQLRFMSYFYWQNVVFPEEDRAVRCCNLGEETLVNRHLAYLLAYPEYEGCPYFALSAKGSLRVYSRDYYAVFNPASVFTSFKDTPITGMAMIGLFPNHNPFKSVSMFEAWSQIGYSKQTERNTGTQLELLFNFGAVLASKVNGPRGCSLLEFLHEFLRQLGCSNFNLKCADGRLLEVDQSGQTRCLPLLSPMPVCSWNSHLVELFESLLPTGQSPCLGYYRTTKGNEPCDGIAYLFDKACPIEVEADATTMEKAMQILKAPYPQKFVRPRIGNMVLLKEFPRNAVYAVECKMHESALSKREIVEIVSGKFKEGVVGNCDLFFIFTTKISDNAVLDLSEELPSEMDPITGREKEDLRLDGVLFWLLNSEVVNGKTNFSLDKLPPSPSQAKQTIKKHVVLLTLESIWGADYQTKYDALSRIQ